MNADDNTDEFLAAARQALRTTGGTAALDALGFWDLLSHLDDESTRTAVMAVFRAHGQVLASTPALGALVAQPYAELLGLRSGSVISALPRPSRRGSEAMIVLGDVAGRSLLVDRPGVGVSLVDIDRVELRHLDVPGRLGVHELRFESAEHVAGIAGIDLERARSRSTAFGRIALSAEILGAAERAVELAVEHATIREQFGQPIASFQAVRHLLAWARADCVGLAGVLGHAVWLDAAAPPRFDQVVKALAGRNGRRACERALQVLGGIGFTAEHEHHHQHRRVLVLDSLLGTSAELTHDLGAWFRELDTDPELTRAILIADTNRNDVPLRTDGSL